MSTPIYQITAAVPRAIDNVADRMAFALDAAHVVAVRDSEEVS